MHTRSGDQFGALRDRLVDNMSRAGRIPNARLAKAFRAVPRHAFLPRLDAELAYRDEAVVTSRAMDGRPVSSSSQPAIMAVMLGQLAVEPGHRVLEIGAGTGYNAALIAHLVGARGSVTTVEIDRDLARRARRNLVGAGFPDVSVICADGGFGWPEHGPYDRIIVTAAAADLPPAWHEQLVDGGRLVVPLSLRGVQRSVAFERAHGYLTSVAVHDCGFMHLRGAYAEPERLWSLGPESRLVLELCEPRTVDCDALYAALAESDDDISTDVRATNADVASGLSLWLALRERDLARLGALGDPVPRCLAPPLIMLPGQAWTAALLGERALAVLVRASPAAARPAQSELCQIAARALGPGGRKLADRLARHVRDWQTHGRPATDALKIRAAARNRSLPPGTSTIETPHTRIVLDWRPAQGSADPSQHHRSGVSGDKH